MVGWQLYYVCKCLWSFSGNLPIVWFCLILEQARWRNSETPPQAQNSWWVLITPRWVESTYCCQSAVFYTCSVHANYRDNYCKILRFGFALDMLRAIFSISNHTTTEYVQGVSLKSYTTLKLLKFKTLSRPIDGGPNVQHTHSGLSPVKSTL